jgi:hypothetical protein
MLALTDQALARIALAASAVALEERGSWLQDLSRRLDPPPVVSPGARYTRRWRARGRNGEVLLRVTVDEAAFAVAAVQHGLLSPELADDRTALTAAAEKALARFSDGETSLRGPGIGDKLSDELVAAVQRREHAEGRRLRTRDAEGARALRRRGG